MMIGISDDFNILETVHDFLTVDFGVEWEIKWLANILVAYFM